MTTFSKCPACGRDNDLLGASDGKPCMDCIRARAKTAMTHRCSCPKRLQRPSEMHQIGSRRWISCERCLGSLRQLS